MPVQRRLTLQQSRLRYVPRLESSLPYVSPGAVRDGRVQFFTKPTSNVAAMLDNTGWTQVANLGGYPGSKTGALFNSTGALALGGYPTGNTGASANINLLAASVATTIDGTPFACWRADPQARQYTDDYGTRWTINGTAWEWRDANALQIGGPQPSDVITGTGFPEGVVTAPVGQRYIDTAATNGAIEWIKASGTGNTGWQVVYGDTGWRSIVAAAMEPRGQGELLLPLRRVGQTIVHAPQCCANNSRCRSASGVMYGLPQGFNAYLSATPSSDLTGYAEEEAIPPWQ